MIAAAPPAPAAVVRLVDAMRARPIEGYYWYVALDDARPRRGRNGIALHAPPGRHTLRFFYRTCDGNCSLLDPPAHRCSTRLLLKAARATRVTITLYNSRCAFRFG